MTRRLGSLLCLLFLCACGDDTMGPDGGAGLCAADSECSDGTFCNGVERCDPDSPTASAFGCVAGSPPCIAGQACDEAAERCDTLCDVATDADGDGSDAIACGGDDCDDSDPDRFPGNAERCDAEGHDEDCDPLTLGDRDEDGDGRVDAACCNGALCGGDCDDSDPAVGAGAVEACNDRDDDCDGSIDEGVRRSFLPDADGDGFGAVDGEALFACTPGSGYVENALDCDDTDRNVNPVRAEVCNGIDDNCDTQIDEVPDVEFACASTFGSPPHTRFSCTDGACAVRCEGTRFDCNGEPSDGCEVDAAVDVSHCGGCGVSCGVGGVCTDGVCDELVWVAAGADHSCVVRSTGTVVCWGANDNGQLGDGTTRDALTPVAVVGITDALEVDASPFGFPPGWLPFTCARSPSFVRCWGANEEGQMGNGATSGIQPAPEVVVDLPTRDHSVGGSPFDQLQPGISLGAMHACASETSVSAPTLSETRCWGRNIGSAISTSSTSVYTTPTYAEGYPYGASSISVAAGLQHTCFAFTASGRRQVRCQGSNASNALGTTGSTNWHSFDLDVDRIDAGYGFTCGIQRAAGSSAPGPVLCWGNGVATPTAVGGLADAVQLSVGYQHACAVRAGGGVVCWGENGAGQLGDGGPTDSAFVVAVPGVSDAVQVAAGARHSCAILASGGASCWGDNRAGQLGRGAATSTGELPGPVTGL